MVVGVTVGKCRGTPDGPSLWAATCTGAFKHLASVPSFGSANTTVRCPTPDARGLSIGELVVLSLCDILLPS
jgi:hypothetical protein